jgi:putative (di)nucleoside polyphosphate hydrolase
VIDRKGFRAGVAIIILNEKNHVFWAKRVGQNAWQFPQGGVMKGESFEDAMYRELYEEVGLRPDDVEIIAVSKKWLRYRLPRKMVRYYSKPVCIGQKQMWFLLRLKSDQATFQFDTTDTPEFDSYRWVRYWFPLRRVIYFKRSVYKKALTEFASLLFERQSRDTLC